VDYKFPELLVRKLSPWPAGCKRVAKSVPSLLGKIVSVRCWDSHRPGCKNGTLQLTQLELTNTVSCSSVVYGYFLLSLPQRTAVTNAALLSNALCTPSRTMEENMKVKYKSTEIFAALRWYLAQIGSYRRFGTTNRSRLPRSSSPRQMQRVITYAVIERMVWGLWLVLRKRGTGQSG